MIDTTIVATPTMIAPTADMMIAVAAGIIVVQAHVEVAEEVMVASTIGVVVSEDAEEGEDAVVVTEDAGGTNCKETNMFTVIHYNISQFEHSTKRLSN